VLPAAAFESLVLSFGMAARTLDLRNERDVARRTAEIDPLTGVLNRRGVFARLEQLQADVAGSDRRHALLYCDLDFFKRINDQHGHDAGDACLQHFVACAQSVLRSEDAIGRIGGEEFVLLLNAQDETQALAVAERLRAKLHESAAVWHDTAIPLTASIGVAFIDAQTPFAAALSKADGALYRAKDEGRDRVCVA
jgi:diguanylate cyclase (GGDEF)-like protein